MWNLWEKYSMVQLCACKWADCENKKNEKIKESLTGFGRESTFCLVVYSFRTIPLVYITYEPYYEQSFVYSRFWESTYFRMCAKNWHIYIAFMGRIILVWIALYASDIPTVFPSSFFLESSCFVKNFLFRLRMGRSCFYIQVSAHSWPNSIFLPKY